MQVLSFQPPSTDRPRCIKSVNGGHVDGNNQWSATAYNKSGSGESTEYKHADTSTVLAALFADDTSRRAFLTTKRGALGEEA